MWCRLLVGCWILMSWWPWLCSVGHTVAKHFATLINKLCYCTRSGSTSPLWKLFFLPAEHDPGWSSHMEAQCLRGCQPAQQTSMSRHACMCIMILYIFMFSFFPPLWLELVPLGSKLLCWEYSNMIHLLVFCCLLHFIGQYGIPLRCLWGNNWWGKGVFEWREFLIVPLEWVFWGRGLALLSSLPLLDVSGWVI